MDHKPTPTTYEDGLETNIYKIAEQICSVPPSPPCSIQFIMDHETDADVEFDLLRDFALACMEILFGPNVTPQDLSETDFEKLNNYIKSVGYLLVVKREETETSYQFKISFERYRSTKPNPFEYLKKYM